MSQSIDYLKYYDLEEYLFEVVRRRFEEKRELTTFDFFSIVVWKANRAKSKIARRLAGQSENGTLDRAVQQISNALAEATSPEARLHVLMRNWGFRLPMASAILSVLWPEEFTVYDIRVCNQLNNFRRLANWSHPGRVWSGYQAYKSAVIAACNSGLSLREMDRFLWARSSANQLMSDIGDVFGANQNHA